MTDTRMTDSEVLDLRYPVRLDGPSIRRGSGGAGRWRGDGTVRRTRFLEPVTAVVVASRRTAAPLRLDGAPGRPSVERADGTVQAMGGSDRAELSPGDALVLETPGGGGFGTPAA